MFAVSGSGRLPGGKVSGKNRAENHAHAAHAHLHSVHPLFSVHDNFSRKIKKRILYPLLICFLHYNICFSSCQPKKRQKINFLTGNFLRRERNGRQKGIRSGVEKVRRKTGRRKKGKREKRASGERCGRKRGGGGRGKNRSRAEAGAEKRKEEAKRTFQR